MGYVFFILIVIFAVLMIPFNEAASIGAAEGLALFIHDLFPTLFPFLICANYITASGVFSKIRFKHAGICAAVCSVLAAVCGTPSAAIICSKINKNGSVDPKRSSMLCAAMNQAGPVFITAALSASIWGQKELALLFAMTHYVPSFLVSVFVSKGIDLNYDKTDIELCGDPIKLFTFSLSEAVTGMLRICGTVVIFRILYSIVFSLGLLDNVDHSIKGLITGVAEMTNGMKLLSPVPSRLNVGICAFLLSFGGVCIFIQSKLVFPELDARRYFLIKSCLGIISFISAILLYPLFSAKAQVFGNWGSETLLDAMALKRTMTMICFSIITAVSLCAMMLISRAVSKK